MRIAIIGRGNIGGTIGDALSRAGHEVVFGVRDPAAAAGPDGRRLVAMADALDGAAAVLLALPAAAVEEFLAGHAGALAGPLVVDATNRIGQPVANAFAAVSAAVPGVRYVRAFNSLGWENFADPVFGDGPADLFYSSQPPDREAVEELIAAVGLRPVWLGPDPDVVDRLLPVWFALVQARGGNRRVAFRVLEKPAVAAG